MDGRDDRRLGSAEAKEKFLGVLREKTGAGLKIFGLAKRAGLDGDGCADGVAIGFCAAKTEGDGISDLCQRVVQDADLRSIAILQNDFKAAVVIEIGESECAAVVEKVHAGDAGNFRERAVAIVQVKSISFKAGPSEIRANQFIDSIPAAFVSK